LVAGTEGHAAGDEDGFEFAFVFGLANGAEDVEVREGGDVVGAADEGNFVGVFDDAAFFDGGAEVGDVELGGAGEGGRVRDLLVDCKDGLGGVRGEEGV
jgi:hypothetical protein